MDGWLFWIYLKAGVSILALIMCVVSALVVWRMRGILQWQHSLGAEMRILEKKLDSSVAPKRQAIQQVLQQCNTIYQSRSPNPKLILHMEDYLRRIAACYYPNTDRPELSLTLGQTIKAANLMVERLDRIVRRKGLHRFARVRIRHVRKAFDWYTKVYHHRVLGLMLRHQKVFGRLMYLKRILLPDPFAWVVYFSNQLTILILTRTLLLDIYLFVGQLAVDAYDPQTMTNNTIKDNRNLAEALAKLYDSEIQDDWQCDPDVAEVRSKLVGIPKRIISPPSLKEWRRSVAKAAHIIASRHFNDSKAPLEEAALGPMIVQLQSLLRSVGDISHYAGVKQLFGIRLASIHSAHAFAGSVSGLPMADLVRKAWGGYRTLRWPYKIFRWVKRSSPTGIAVDLGREAMRKTLINYLARFTFDQTCRTIETLYRNSK